MPLFWIYQGSNIRCDQEAHKLSLLPPLVLAWDQNSDPKPGTMISWYIWKAWNEYFFHDSPINPKLVLRNPSSGLPPGKLNFDGSIQPRKQVSGIGGMIHVHNRSAVGAFSYPLQAELEAPVKGAVQLKVLQLNQIILEEDGLIILKALSSNGSLSWNLMSLWKWIVQGLETSNVGRQISATAMLINLQMPLQRLSNHKRSSPTPHGSHIGVRYLLTLRRSLEMRFLLIVIFCRFVASRGMQIGGQASSLIYMLNQDIALECFQSSFWNHDPIYLLFRFLVKSHFKQKKKGDVYNERKSRRWKMSTKKWIDSEHILSLMEKYHQIKWFIIDKAFFHVSGVEHSEFYFT